ncbi:MAG: hypothetical protein JWP18_610 [Solirubrobacterales bacterium]|jgi:hypothetical protein|nr:hypothetical protein [Solirubrobacterales bacterium]
MSPPDHAAVDLLWLPLGAGGRSVRLNGKAYEALMARLGQRAPRDLYHSALVVHLGDARTVVEMAPVFSAPPERSGVVASGAVGTTLLGRSRFFRYGIRRWEGGEIPDIAEAVGAPLRLSSDARTARRLLELVPQVPTPVWGRDELRTGEMWNSNSLIAWLLVRSGIGTTALAPPDGGRAPGWDAGLQVATRQLRTLPRRAA